MLIRTYSYLCMCIQTSWCVFVRIRTHSCSFPFRHMYSFLFVRFHVYSYVFILALKVKFTWLQTYRCNNLAEWIFDGKWRPTFVFATFVFIRVSLNEIYVIVALNFGHIWNYSLRNLIWILQFDCQWISVWISVWIFKWFFMCLFYGFKHSQENPHKKTYQNTLAIQQQARSIMSGRCVHWWLRRVVGDRNDDHEFVGNHDIDFPIRVFLLLFFFHTIGLLGGRSEH